MHSRQEDERGIVWMTQQVPAVTPRQTHFDRSLDTGLTIFQRAGARSRWRREELGISLRSAARYIDIDPAQLSRWETGQKPDWELSALNAARLATLLQVNPSWLAGLHDQQSDLAFPPVGRLESADEILDQMIYDTETLVARGLEPELRDVLVDTLRLIQRNHRRMTGF